MEKLFLGVDLGGTNVKLGVATAGGEVRGRMSIPTEGERGPADTLDRIAAAARELLKKTGPAQACGSGVPGPLDLQRTILFNAINIPGWRNVPYPKMLQDRLGIPTFMENDANCAAWGEYLCGAGRGTRSLVLYTLGTGVGGGIILNGDLWVGASGAAGELGHMTIEIDGLPCGCGQKGCVEQYASATALARRWGRGTAKGCFEAARRGDPEALAAVEWSCNALSIGLANMIHVLHPEIIVLAGGMAAAGDMLLDRVREGVRSRVFPICLDRIRIELSKIPGDDAGWLGAALWAARKTDAYGIREPTA